jgi:hypothetical protein
MEPVVLTAMEAAMLKAQGWSEPKAERLNAREFRVVMLRGENKAEALGTSPDHATRNLIRLVTR